MKAAIHPYGRTSSCVFRDAVKEGLTLYPTVLVSLFFQCLCLSPTYELALQTGKVIEQMGRFYPELKLAYAVRGNKCKSEFVRLGCWDAGGEKETASKLGFLKLFLLMGTFSHLGKLFDQSVQGYESYKKMQG